LQAAFASPPARCWLSKGMSNECKVCPNAEASPDFIFLAARTKQFYAVHLNRLLLRVGGVQRNQSLHYGPRKTSSEKHFLNLSEMSSQNRCVPNHFIVPCPLVKRCGISFLIDKRFQRSMILVPIWIIMAISVMRYHWHSRLWFLCLLLRSDFSYCFLLYSFFLCYYIKESKKYSLSF
jgi:hypothetical protein